MADVSVTRNRDNLVKMMLLSSGAALSSTISTVSSILPSNPSVEYSDDNANRLSAYLHRISGLSEHEIDAVVKDHCYAKPWNWKPDNIYVKPVKKLFFNKTRVSIREKLNAEKDIDVDGVDHEDRSTPCDLTKIRHQMEEFRRLANFVRPDTDNDDDWEDKIEKILWLPIHHRVFSRVLRILSSERLARLAKSMSWSEPIFRRTSVDTAARRFRETLASTGWDWRMTQWLHGLLCDHAPREYLAIYFDILQTLRAKIPQLIDRMIAVQPNINAKVGAITWETLSSLLKRSWDPFASCLNSNRPKKLPGNPILIVAPSSICANVSSRQQKWITQLGTLGMVVNVHTHQGIAASRLTMMACMDQLVQATRAKIQDVRVDCPGRPIILVGFNGGAALACQVAQMEHVTAVICLGFPFTTVEGKRGTPDDTLMDIRCPVMFVIGENASLVRPDDLEDVREKLLVETSLVVVGTADDHLRISTSKKLSDGITQSTVDRCILDEIGDFVASILLQPHPLPPRPFSMSSSYEVREKPAKKEPRKRKISTSSSVDSETNVSPNVKKSRPGTPTVSMASNSNAFTIAPRFASIAGQSITGATGIRDSSVAPIINNSQPPGQKRKSRVSNSNQKNHYSDHMVSSKHLSQHASSANGGITLNIGSLASLAPIGPIRLAPGGVNHSSLSGIKGGIDYSRSPITLGPKMPKIMQTCVQTQPTRIKTVLPASSSSSSWSKGFSKINSANCNNRNIVNLTDKAAAIDILNTLGNQIAVSSSPLAGFQSKSTINPTSSSGSLTALLQSGKSALGTMVGGSRGGGPGSHPSSSSSILLTPCINNSSINAVPATLTTTSSSAKVTDSSIISSITGADGSSDRLQIENSIISSCSTKKNAPGGISLELESVASTSENGHDETSTMLLPFVNKTTATILPLSGRFKTAGGQRFGGNTVPKITMNSNSSQKSQRGKLQTIRNNTNIVNQVDDDLGNILDIPIIFAKDGENFNTIERESLPYGQIRSSNPRLETIDIKPKRLATTTKVVLISNKQQTDKKKTFNQSNHNIVRSTVSSDIGQRNVAQVIVHSRSENQPISLATSGNWNSSVNLPSGSRANQPTIKYTKIILAKRNNGLTGANNIDKSHQQQQQIILTKSATKLSVAKSFSRDTNDRKSPVSRMKILTNNAQIDNRSEHDGLEIEDAIKTNIIERKIPTNIPQIDLTSPTKNQIQRESSVEKNPT